MYGRSAAQPAASVETPTSIAWWRVLGSRIITFCWVEVAKIRHDRTELYTRAVQPALWLLIFGETFTRLRAIPTGGRPYLDFMTPGVIAQSALFVSIFYGIVLVLIAVGVLAYLGRRRQKRAQAERAQQVAAR